MESPLISIIIPTYNTASVITRTLTSVEKQTYSNYEIVIVNDGSIDNTKMLLDNYKNNKPNVVVYHQNNQGVSSARNKGIELANGQFICFLDSDDTYEPTFLEDMIKRQKETDGKVIYCGTNYINKKRENKSLKNIKFDEGDILKNYFDEQGDFLFYFQGMIFEKNLLSINNIKFNTDMRLGEDLFFVIQVMIVTKIYAVKKYLFNYYYRQDSTSKKKWSSEDRLSSINTRYAIFNHINNHYTGDKKETILQCLKVSIFNQQADFLADLLSTFRFNKIKNYAELNDFIQYGHKNYHLLDKSRRKKFNFIKKNSLFSFFLGAIYYKYIRVL